MTALFSIGFLLGFAHAFEADHLAAVSALVAGKKRRLTMLLQGVLWGLGHTIALFVASGIVLATGLAIGPTVANSIEFMVGLMLVALGGHVFYRLHRDRVHFHTHKHGHDAKHVHLHSHAGESLAHQQNPHHHEHPDHVGLRSLFVGLMHGLAGSAALLLVAAAAMDSVWASLGYISLFGIGSILGMAGMSMLIAVPLAYTARVLTRANFAMQILVGLATVGIGARTVFVTASVLLA